MKNTEFLLSRKLLRKLGGLVRRDTPMDVMLDESGYDQYHDVNVYGVMCPNCGYTVFEFTDHDLHTGNSLLDDLPTLFRKNFSVHQYEGSMQFCERCGQRLRFPGDKREEDGESWIGVK